MLEFKKSRGEIAAIMLLFKSIEILKSKIRESCCFSNLIRHCLPELHIKKFFILEIAGAPSIKKQY